MTNTRKGAESAGLVRPPTRSTLVLTGELLSWQSGARACLRSAPRTAAVAAEAPVGLTISVRGRDGVHASERSLNSYQSL